MKYVLAAAVLCLPVIACNNAETAGDDAATGTMATEASSSATPMAPAQITPPVESIADYVPAAAVGDMYEIQSAEIALERSENPEVQALARMIREDHTQASDKMKALAPQAAPEIRLPTALDDRHARLISALREAPADAFDRTYLDQQVSAHEEALALHRGFSQTTQAPALAEHARSVVPPIERHLERARALMNGGA